MLRRGGGGVPLIPMLFAFDNCTRMALCNPCVPKTPQTGGKSLWMAANIPTSTLTPSSIPTAHPFCVRPGCLSFPL